ADLPETGPLVAAGGRRQVGMRVGRRDRVRVLLGDLDRLGLRDLRLLRAGRAREQEEKCESEGGGEEWRPDQAKVHSLLPMKLNGIATATAIACEGMSAMPLRTSSSSTTRLITSAATLTAKKRAAWNPACPCFASKVQCRFHQKLLVTATQKARIAEGMWWMPKGPTTTAKTARLTT